MSRQELLDKRRRQIGYWNQVTFDTFFVGLIGRISDERMRAMAAYGSAALADFDK